MYRAKLEGLSSSMRMIWTLRGMIMMRMRVNRTSSSMVTTSRMRVIIFCRLSMHVIFTSELWLRKSFKWTAAHVMHQGRIPHVRLSVSSCSANELLLKLATGLENSLPMIEAVFWFNNQDIPYKGRIGAYMTRVSQEKSITPLCSHG